MVEVMSDYIHWRKGTPPASIRPLEVNLLSIDDYFGTSPQALITDISTLYINYKKRSSTLQYIVAWFCPIVLFQ